MTVVETQEVLGEVVAPGLTVGDRSVAPIPEIRMVTLVAPVTGKFVCRMPNTPKTKV